MKKEKIEVGRFFSNKELYKTFKCASGGGMRLSTTYNCLIITSNDDQDLYDDELDGNILKYTGTGKNGQQTLIGNQNKTLFESESNGVTILFFKQMSGGGFKYQGIAELTDNPYEDTQRGADGEPRSVWMFPLKITPKDYFIIHMELVYLWIEDHKNIKNKGFNFSPDYDFKLKKIDGERYYFEYKIKKETPDNFFGENISNITAIIGENGSGKSSSIESFSNFLAYKNYSKGDNHAFENGYKKIFYIFMINKNKFYFSTRNSSLKGNVFLNGVRLEHKIAFPHIIYYDNIIAKKPKNRNKNVIFKDLNISSQEYFFKNNSDLNKFASSESERNIFFLKKYSKINQLKEEIEIKFPETVFLKARNVFFTDKIQDLTGFNNKILKEISLTMLERFGLRNEVNSFIKTEKMSDRLKIYFNTLKSILKKYQENRETYEIFIEKKITTSEEKKIFNELIDYSNQLQLFKNNNIKDENNMEELKKYFIFVKNFYSNVYLKYNDLINKDLKEVSFENEKLGISFSKKYDSGIAKFSETNNINFLEEEFLDYSFDVDMSSGERAILGLFSRIYSIKEKRKITKDEIIIVLDEPELFMHPEWQRKFLNIFITFINIIFSKKNVQIILTSHSPFIASDLPKENLIMLQTYSEKDKEVKLSENDENFQKIGNCKIKSDTELNTFGANIFDLYKDAFFLKSTFGEFSKNKIKNIIIDLTPDKKGNYREVDKTKVKYIMESIGEPLLKNKLNKMWKNFQMWELSKNNNKMGSVEKKMKLAMEKYGLSEEELITFRGFKGVNDDKNR